jgi:uncharacterized protein (DUF983 family)
MKTRSLGAAIAQGKCPQCREGNIFPTSLYSYRKLTAVNHHCGKCAANFNPEPDFYMGAMFVSYAFSVALVVTVLVALNILMERPPFWMYVVVIVGANVLLLPLLLRYSKILYLYGVGKLKYNPQAATKK